MYLTDEDLIKGLLDCIDALTINEETGESGLIIVKDNVKDAGKDMRLDREDNSVTRSIEHYNNLFESVGLEKLHGSFTPGWPKDLYPLFMWVLRKKK